MSAQIFRNCITAVALIIGILSAPAANAAVTVDIVDANTAIGHVSLTDASSNIYTADVTIAFDQAVNLSVDSLNLTAELIDPSNPPTLPANVSIDPAFPVLVSVEPPVALFMNSYESNQTGDGNLALFNTYQIEIHTTNLTCSSATSSYRLYKAPHGSSIFADYSEDLLSGSVRSRGRDGAFSQFIIVKDNRAQLLLGLVPVIALDKLTNLTTRLLASTLNGGLLTTLTATLTTVLNALLSVIPNYGVAISNLDQFIAQIQTGVTNGDIANEWKSDRSVNNDAGELLGLAETLRFTLGILNGDALCLPPAAH